MKSNNWTDTPCEIFDGYINGQGYGQVYAGNGKSRNAHILAWEKVNGAIPKLKPRLVLDHLCRNRACVNVNHLDLVTDKVNTLRGIGPTAINAKKTHCPKGHELSGENLLDYNCRRCRICQKEADERWYAKITARKPAFGINTKIRPVIATDASTGEEKFYKSITEAAQHGFNYSCIYLCLRGARKIHNDHYWRDADQVSALEKKGTQ